MQFVKDQINKQHKKADGTMSNLQAIIDSNHKLMKTTVARLEDEVTAKVSHESFFYSKSYIGTS